MQFRLDVQHQTQQQIGTENKCTKSSITQEKKQQNTRDKGEYGYMQKH